MSEAVQGAGEASAAGDRSPVAVAAAVIACLPNGQLRVRTGAGAELTAHVGGDLRRAMPNLVPGDQVLIETAQLDPARARVVRRVVRRAQRAATVPQHAVNPARENPNQRDKS